METIESKIKLFLALAGEKKRIKYTDLKYEYNPLTFRKVAYREGFSVLIDREKNEVIVAKKEINIGG